jgi:hypothetical protein
MDTVTLESVFTAVNTIYEAAFDQERWGDAVCLLRDLFGGSRACILRFGPDDSEAVCSLDDPELNSIAGLQAVLSDPLVEVHLAMPVGAVWQRAAIVDEAAFRKRELWQDWFGPRDMHGQLVCKLASSSTANWFLDINRGPGRRRSAPPTSISWRRSRRTCCGPGRSVDTSPAPVRRLPS